MNDVKRSSAASARSEPKASVRALVVASKASAIDFKWLGSRSPEITSLLNLSVIALGTEETIEDEDTVESNAVVWGTFNREAADRTATSVDDFESGILIEHDAELAVDLEVEGTIRLIEDGEVTEIAVARES